MPDHSSPDMTRSSASDADILLATLPDIERLALAYAPREARLPTLALFALDARLAGLLRHSSEPMLAQLRLAWWRESLAADPVSWPQGEPLLSALKSWNGAQSQLPKLVDGWEALTGPAPLMSAPLNAMADGRAAACAALASALGQGREADAAFALGRRWALADLAMRLGNEQERSIAQGLAFEAFDGPSFHVSRTLRPLAVLAALAQRRAVAGNDDAARSPAALLQALRIGLLGR